MGLPKDDCSADSIKKRVVAEDADLKPFLGESFQKLYTYLPFRTHHGQPPWLTCTLIATEELATQKQKSIRPSPQFLHPRVRGRRYRTLAGAARGATQEEKLPRQTALLNLGVPEGKVLGGEALFLDKNTNDGMHDWALRDHDATTESQ